MQVSGLRKLVAAAAAHCRPCWLCPHYNWLLLAGMWASTVVTGVKYDKAVAAGFWRLFKYISGNNEQQQKVEMTAPVTVRVTPSQGPFCEDNFTISFFVPFDFQVRICWQGF